MKIVKEGIVFSEDINIILNGKNAFDFKYDKVPSMSVIEDVRRNFKEQVNSIFNGKAIIIGEDEMNAVNGLIGGEYPHCIFR